MGEKILATVKDGEVIIYVEVLAALRGEIHEGMLANSSVIVNPYASELQKITVKTEDERTVNFFEFLASRRETKGDSVVYYATIK